MHGRHISPPRSLRYSVSPVSGGGLSPLAPGYIQVVRSGTATILWFLAPIRRPLRAQLRDECAAGAFVKRGYCLRRPEA